MAASILDEIVADKREELARRREQEPLAALREKIAALPPLWSFAHAITEGPRGPHAGGHGLQLIAEIKKASPSRGRFVSVLEHRAIGRTYTIGGAAAISVVTEEKHFLGRLRFLNDLRISLDGYSPGGRPALLRKDFLFDPYHIYEARAYSAEAVLLIVAILDDSQLAELIGLAQDMGMDALVEVHDESEVERALKAGASIIGVNNRDLRTFEVDLAVTERLRPLIPNDKIVVSESGILGRAEAERLRDAGVQAILVGEALMTAQNVREKMREFLP